MLLDKPLQTDRLILRSLGAGDATPAYARWLADPEVVRHLEVRFAPPQTIERIREFIATTNASASSLLLGICLKDPVHMSGQHIGNIKLGPIDGVHGRADIGFLIGEKSCWGQGYASEAIVALSDYALDHLGVRKVTAGCYAGNAASAKALLRAGFWQEAVLARHWQFEGERVDGWLFGKWREPSQEQDA